MPRWKETTEAPKMALLVGNPAFQKEGKLRKPRINSETGGGIKLMKKEMTFS